MQFDKTAARGALIRKLKATVPENRDFANVPPGERIPRDAVFVIGCDGTSPRYRVHNLVEGLVEMGYDAAALPGFRVGRLLECPAPKAAVFFRCANLPNLPFAQAAYDLQRRGCRVVIDNDDLVFNPDILERHDAFLQLSLLEQRKYMADSLLYREFMLLCDAATMTTDYLAGEAGKLVEDVRVVPNSVNLRQLELSERLLGAPLKKRDGFIVFYSSGSNTHSDDFMVCTPALERFMGERPEVSLVIVGMLEPPAALEKFGERVIRLPFMPYERQMAENSRADINIAPLTQTPFNHSKSELKIFEPGLVGVPTICSPVDSYARYVEDGLDAVLADSDEEWYRAFCSLTDDPALRAKIGSAARKKALAKNHYLTVSKTVADVLGFTPHSGTEPIDIPDGNAAKRRVTNRIEREIAAGPAVTETPGCFAGNETLAEDIVFVVGCDGTPARYRVFNLADGLRELGYDVAVLPGHRIGRLMEVRAPKVAVIFRSPDLAHLPYARTVWDLQRRGCRVVMDYDDLVFNPDVVEYMGDYAAMDHSGQSEFLDVIQRFRELLLLADAVTVSTRALAVEAKKLVDAVHVVPSSMNFRQLRLSERLQTSPLPRSREFTLFYSSGSPTHAKDFGECARAVERFMDERPASRLVVCGPCTLPDAFDRFGNRVVRTPFLPYEKHMEELSRCDACLAPYVRSLYNDCKCERRLFEAGAVGVPAVASPTDAFSRYAVHGVDALLASSENEWYDSLCALADNPGFGAEMGARIRDKALRENDYLSTAKLAVKAYGLGEPSRDGEPAAASFPLRRPDPECLNLTWLLPEYRENCRFQDNVYRVVYHLARLGHNITLRYYGMDRDEERMLDDIRRNYWPVKAAIRKGTSDLESCDAVIATDWTTMYAAYDNKNATRGIVYFVQDYEPARETVGDRRIAAENSYMLGAFHLAAGDWCGDFLASRYGVKPGVFRFPVDRSVYRPRRRNKKGENIVFHASPDGPGSCFQLGISVIEKLAVVRPGCELIFYAPGLAVDAEPTCSATVIRNALTPLECADLYSDADVGVYLSDVAPDTIPYEMLACGLPVVTLDRNGNRAHYGGRSDIALLAGTLPEVIADAALSLLDNPQEREARSDAGLAFVNALPTEEDMGRHIGKLIVDTIASF
jgi:glycosyltransferase involved in cell wall biosynthesis